MNRQFYEFWGKYFTSVAQGQKHLEDMAGWMERGFSDRGEMATLFRRCYGLDDKEKDGTENLLKWQKATADFMESFAKTATIWGWVSQTEHQKVKDRCAELEKEVQQQKETINQLRDLLNQEGLGHSALLQHFQGVFEAQSEQFQKLMKTFNEAAKS